MDESKTADIVELIGGIDDGALYAQLQDDLTDLVAALRKRFAAAGGSPKAKLKIELAFRFDGKIVEILPSVTTQLPRPVRGKGVFWATRDNKLSPQNPQQLDLGVPARDVATEAPRHLQKA
jgi:hypothetical protein